MSNARRPPIRIRFNFNIETGDIEIIIDDASPDRSEDYHDGVAHAIASYLSRHPEIRDAGPIRYTFNREAQTLPDTREQQGQQDQQPELTD